MKMIIIGMLALSTLTAFASEADYTCLIYKDTKVSSEVRETGLAVMKAKISRTELKIVRIFEGPLSLSLSNNFGYALTLEATLRDESLEPVKPLKTITVKLNLSQPELNPKKIVESIKINEESDLRVECSLD